MSTTPAILRHEYDLGSLQRIRPRGHDFEMLVTPRYRSHFLDSRYEAYTATLLGAVSRGHRLFVDVGAHYGFYSLLAATRNPDLEVVALEPVPETFQVLARNLTGEGLPASGALRKAASDRSGRARFSISSASENCGFYPHPWAPPIAEIEVETVTLDQVLAGREPCPMVVKIDTDGHELAVLAGMAETLERSPEIKLFVELNPKMQRLAGRDPQDLPADLDRRGFAVFLLDELAGRAYRLRRPSDWSGLMREHEGCVNLYCCRKESAVSVCFVSQSVALAGAERSLMELVSELVVDHGAICSVVVPGEGQLVDRLRGAGASTLAAPYDWWCDLPLEPDGLRASETDPLQRLVPSALALLGEPLQELRRIDPDVLVTHTIAVPWGAMLAEILGKPHVWHLCEYGELDHGFRFLLPADEVIREIRSSSDHIFTANDGIREVLFPGDHGASFSTLYRHVEVPSEPADHRPTQALGPAGAVRVGVFGSLCSAKGQDLVIQAVARLVERGRHVDLFLVGPHQGGFPGRLVELIRSHGLQGSVHLPGFVEDVFPMMRSMDVVVVGSRMEAFGRSAVEAMLLARPVVYPLAGGPAEYMSDGVTGLGYAPEDVDAMAEAIDRLLLDPSLRTKLGQQAREHARATFTRQRYGGTAVRVFRQLRDSHRAGVGTRRSPWWARLVPGLIEEAEGQARRNLEVELAELKDELLRIDATYRREQEDASRRLQRAQGYLDTVLGSATWRIALWLRRPVDLLAPYGSRRRELLKDLILNRAR